MTSRTPRSTASGARDSAKPDNGDDTRANTNHIESVLFADWGGDPVSRRSTGDDPHRSRVNRHWVPANRKPPRAGVFRSNSVAFVLERIADMPVEQTLDLEPKPHRQNGSI